MLGFKEKKKFKGLSWATVAQSEIRCFDFNVQHLTPTICSECTRYVFVNISLVHEPVSHYRKSWRIWETTLCEIIKSKILFCTVITRRSRSVFVLLRGRRLVFSAADFQASSNSFKKLIEMNNHMHVSLRNYFEEMRLKRRFQFSLRYHVLPSNTKHFRMRKK